MKNQDQVTVLNNPNNTEDFAFAGCKGTIIGIDRILDGTIVIVKLKNGATAEYWEDEVMLINC